MKQFLFLLTLVITIFSCQQNDKKSAINFGKLLNTKALPSQIFKININKNNTLVTEGSVYIQIEKDAIVSNQDIVELEVKEALNAEQIALAGLVTQTNGIALSSGGMIFINAAVGYQFEIKKAIKVFVPTSNYQPNMQLYEGKINKDSSINWVNPKPLTKNSKLSHGEQLFISNCKSCHAIDKHTTGPSLWNVQNRRTKKWLYDFTRNPAKVIAASSTGESLPADSQHDTMKYSTGERLDSYANCLYNSWNKTAMTAFPSLSDKDLEDLYSYIKDESDKHPELASVYGSNCCDSCIKYKQANEALQRERTELIYDNEQLFSLKSAPPILTNSNIVSPNQNNISQTRTPRGKPGLSLKNERGVYYEFSITKTGWYNIDILLSNIPGVKQSSVIIRIRKQQSVDYHLMLFIPRRNVSLEGGVIDGVTTFGAYENDGLIPLPIGDSCIVLAFAESESKFMTGFAKFNAVEKQVLDITTNETSSTQIQEIIKSFNLNGISAMLNDSKNANQIREIDSKRIENEKWKPANCDCDIIKSEQVIKGEPLQNEFN